MVNNCICREKTLVFPNMRSERREKNDDGGNCAHSVHLGDFCLVFGLSTTFRAIYYEAPPSFLVFRLRDGTSRGGEKLSSAVILCCKQPPLVSRKFCAHLSSCYTVHYEHAYILEK